MGCPNGNRSNKSSILIMSLNNKISVYGSSGFIGSTFCKKYESEIVKIPRTQRIPESNNILYFISTTDNYNIFEDITLDVKTNLLTLCEVLGAIRDSGQAQQTTINFVSSWFVYGPTPLWCLPVHEEFDKAPLGFYSITKSCAEDLIISFCKTFGSKCNIFRLSNVYGLGDKKASKKKNALQYLIEKIKKDESIELYNNGNIFRDFIHVKDACRAIHHLITSDFDRDEIQHRYMNDIVYNIGSGEKRSIGELVDMCYGILKKERKITSIEPTNFHKTIQSEHMVLDISKLKDTGFDLSQNIKIYDGLKEICNS